MQVSHFSPLRHWRITSLTFLLITSPAMRERKPPATDSNCTMRVATARGRFPQYAEMLAGSYTNGKNSLLSSTYTITLRNTNFLLHSSSKMRFKQVYFLMVENLVDRNHNISMIYSFCHFSCKTSSIF